MSFSRPRGFLFPTGFLMVWLAAFPALAQMHEQPPPPGLDKGILLNTGAAQLSGDVGTGDFSMVLNAKLAALDECALFTNEGWVLKLHPDGSLAFSATEPGSALPINVTTRPGAISAPGSASIVVSVKRDARQPYTGIWVNGIELASGVMPPIRCSAARSAVSSDPGKLEALSVRVYDRALLRAEVVDLALDFQKPKAPAAQLPPAQASAAAHDPLFVPGTDETIALLGGTEAAMLAESGELEARLLVAFPQTHLHFRNLAWEGDTVLRQDRPLNYGDLTQQLRRVNAGAVFLMFGRQECLDGGSEGLAAFKEAYEKLLGIALAQTPRVVIIGSAPFEKKAPPLPDLSGRNADLTHYNEALRDLAAHHGLVFVNVMGGGNSAFAGATSQSLTHDGVLFTQTGQQVLAEAIRTELKIAPPAAGGAAPSEAAFEGSLPAQIAAKNHLWHDYWRPSNWAFLYGDRTNQPSSRDPVNPQIRLFPSEQEQYLPLIKDAEAKVFRLVEETNKKLP